MNQFETAVGEIVLMAADRMPLSSYLFCNGKHQSNNTYSVLAGKIEEAYGAGPGWFAVPDMTAPEHMSYQICAAGDWILGNGTVGEIALLAGTLGQNTGAWFPCDGRSLSVSRYPSLFKALGPGSADGTGQFKIPDFSPADNNMSYWVCAVGSDPSWMSHPGKPYMHGLIGKVLYMANEQAPTSGNFLPTKGQELSISQYPALYSVIANRYGGNGTTTFALPTMADPQPGIQTVICVDGIYPLWS